MCAALGAGFSAFDASAVARPIPTNTTTKPAVSTEAGARVFATSALVLISGLREEYHCSGGRARLVDRKSTRLNSSPTEIYTLYLHDALPICCQHGGRRACLCYLRTRSDKWTA